MAWQPFITHCVYRKHRIRVTLTLFDWRLSCRAGQPRSGLHRSLLKTLGNKVWWPNTMRKATHIYVNLTRIEKLRTWCKAIDNYIHKNYYNYIFQFNEILWSCVNGFCRLFGVFGVFFFVVCLVIFHLISETSNIYEIMCLLVEYFKIKINHTYFTLMSSPTYQWHTKHKEMSLLYFDTWPNLSIA